MKRVATFLVGVIALTAGPTEAADKACKMSALGKRSVVTCRIWNGARAADDREEYERLVEWTGGYITARNIYAPGTTQELRNNAIAALLDEQCRDPSTIFMEAVHNLTVYLGGAVTRSCQ